VRKRRVCYDGLFLNVLAPGCVVCRRKLRHAKITTGDGCWLTASRHILFSYRVTHQGMFMSLVFSYFGIRSGVHGETPI